MLLRHIASCRSTNHVRSSFPAFSGVRSFSSGQIRPQAPKPQPRDWNLIRKVSFKPKSTTDPHRYKTPSTSRVEATFRSGLSNSDPKKWIAHPRKPSYPSIFCGITLDTCKHKEIEAQLPEHLRQDPLKPFTEDPDAVDIPLAGQCMQLYIYRLMEQTLGQGRQGQLLDRLLDRTLDLSEFRTRLMHDDAGAKALSWLLKPNNINQLEATYDATFILATAFCLVGAGEARADIWWDMLTINHAPKSVKGTAISNEKYSALRWSKLWVGAVFEAQMFWTTEQNILNDPLATFTRILRFNESQRTPEARLNISGAFTWTMARLPFYDKRNMNVGDYDTFTNFVSRFLCHSPLSALLNSGLLKLMHPVHPRAEPLLGFFHQTEFDKDILQYTKSIPPGYLLLTITLLTQYCYSVGRKDDVDWALNFYYTIKGEQEKSEGARGSQKNHWARRTVGRKATPAEIADGLEVDAQGRLVPIDYRETLEEAHEREKKRGGH